MNTRKVKGLTSCKPYLLRATYQWICDNDHTPFLLARADVPGVEVPTGDVEDGLILFKISPESVSDFIISNQAIEFKARCSGILHHVYLPMQAVKSIYSYELNKGPVFHDKDVDDGDGTSRNNKVDNFTLQLEELVDVRPQYKNSKNYQELFKQSFAEFDSDENDENSNDKNPMSTVTENTNIAQSTKKTNRSKTFKRPKLTLVDID